VIDQHVDWIADVASLREGSRVLDIACGPGLYTSRLAKRGCECVGIDFAPASIEYARQCAKEDGLEITYKLGDVRTANFGESYDLAMFLFGEFNVFKREDLKCLLERTRASLREGGTLIIEPSRFGAFGKSRRESSWQSFESSVFSDRPHTSLEEIWWDATTKTETRRYYIIDAESDELSTMASTSQAYTDREYRAVLSKCGFTSVEFYPSLIGIETDVTPEMMVIVARK
jgi:cyclopropane fatty-acyl-phospholipid synthase-like methyltransferase